MRTGHAIITFRPREGQTSENTVKIVYYDSADAAYIKLISKDDAAPYGFTYCCDPDVVDGQIHLDFDTRGRLIGIEILSASSKLPSHLLRNGEDSVSPC